MIKLKTRIDAPFVDRKRSWREWRVVVGACAGLFFAHDASAIFTISAYTPVRQITMRVGSAGTTVNDVTFNVTGANISPTPVSVTGTPSASTPATSPVGGTEVTVTAGLVNRARLRVVLTANSSAGMTCVAGTGCGTTVIPFTTVSWTAYNHGTFPTFDIQNGTFTGAANQTLADIPVGRGGGRVNGGSVTMSNVLVFQYNNATLYPSGQYKGRVVYTASIP